MRVRIPHPKTQIYLFRSRFTKLPNAAAFGSFFNLPPLKDEKILTKNDFKSVFKSTLPVMSGYVVLGMGFGILMSTSGLNVWWTLAMSLFIYAGSMQYAAVGLLTGGASLLTVALTTLAVNARHLFYGISMIDKYRSAGAKKPYLIFALTDETYSLVCTGDKSCDFCFFVSLFDHFYWVAGSVIGSLLAGMIKFNTRGIEFSLTALFITIFADMIITKKEYFSAVCGIASSVLCLLIFGKENFLIPSMIVITIVLLADMGRKSRVK